MRERNSYPLSINPAVIEAMQRYNEDEQSSLNGQNK